VAREESCRELFRYDLEPGLVDEVRKATNANVELEYEWFKEEISKALAR